MAPTYKSMLQMHIQKSEIGIPSYGYEMQGPPHCRGFKAKVTIDGHIYVGNEFRSTLRDAENEAARVAFLSLSADGSQKDDCVYKNLLQEWAQRRHLDLPVYTTKGSGKPHVMSFGSTVKIAGKCYVGQEASTKKQAEMNAAKLAYNALLNGEPSANSSSATSLNIHVAGTSSFGSYSLQSPETHKEAAKPVAKAARTSTRLTPKKKAAAAPEVAPAKRGRVTTRRSKQV